MNFLPLAFVLLSLTWLPLGQTSSCSFTLGTQSFDVCAFGSIVTPFTLDTVIEGQLSFSLSTPRVTDCAGSSTAYSVIKDGIGGCYDVATQDAVYSLLNPKNSLTGGIKISFPEVRNAANTKGFKLEVLLSCGPDQSTITTSSFSMSKIFGQTTTGTTTYTVSASAHYGCAVVSGCPPIMIGSASYKLCDLNGTLFDRYDTLGGRLKFNLGGTPLVDGCSWPHENMKIFGIYYTAGKDAAGTAGYCVSASDASIPTYSPINYYNPKVGLQINYKMPSSTMINFLPQITFNLLCDSTKTLLADIQPTIETTFSGWDLKFVLTASSAYACPLPP